MGIEWGFFLAFVAAGCLTYAGVRMRAAEAPEAPLTAAQAVARLPPAEGSPTGRRPGRRPGTGTEPTGGAALKARG